MTDKEITIVMFAATSFFFLACIIVEAIIN